MPAPIPAIPGPEPEKQVAAGALLALLQLPMSPAFVVVPAAQRQPAAAPRFDTFCEQIVGRWVQRDGAVFDVEEVMRACGGAVQGVKEGALYHNRADDGFLYFPCGSTQDFAEIGTL